MQLLQIDNFTEFTDHALYEYPKEICGVVIESKFIPCENVAFNPIDQFEIADSEYLKYKDSIEGIIHTHTHNHFKFDGRVPTKEDMILGDTFNTIPCGIAHVSPNHVSPILIHNRTHLRSVYDRPYIPNIYDCYTLVRDYFWLKKKITLAARGPDWLNKEPELIEVNKNINFKSTTLLHKDNVVMFRIGSVYGNHLGVMLNNTDFIHHLEGRNSTVDKISKWNRQLVEVRELI